MEVETTLAEAIDTAGENAKYDAACKRLLSEKYILAWIMKSCLTEYQDCTIEEIAEKYIEGQPAVESVPVAPDKTNPVIQGLRTVDTSKSEGTITYDVRFAAYAPGTNDLIRLIINVESQLKYNAGYPLLKRAIYYCGRMISSQYGTEFTNAEYAGVCKVYSIWICPAPPQHHQNTITRYRMTEENIIGRVKEAVENYDLMTVIVLGLGDPDEAGNTENADILRLLSVLLSSETNESEKKRILHDDYSIPITETMERSLTEMCNLSQGVEEKGIAKGLARGLAEGRAEGRIEATLTHIRNLVDSMGFTVEKAMSALQIPEEDRTKYAELLAKQ